jgi:hypothetical protein
MTPHLPFAATVSRAQKVILVYNLLLTNGTANPITDVGAHSRRRPTFGSSPATRS